MKNTLIFGLLALVMLQSCENKDRLNAIKQQLNNDYLGVEYKIEKNGKRSLKCKEVVRGTAPSKFYKASKPSSVSLLPPKINKPAPPQMEFNYLGDYYNDYYNDYDYYPETDYIDYEDY
jgi:hypothetical protein